MAGIRVPSDNAVGFSVYAGLEERVQDKELRSALRSLRKVTAADVARLAPEIRNPLLSSVNFYLPAERSILNQWIRYYDRFHPLVGNAIDLHAELPLSRFGLKGLADTKKLDFYMEMVEEMDLYSFMVDMAREYFLLGEVVPYLVWDDDFNCFTRAELINPDYVDVRGHPLVTSGGESYRYELIPDQTIRDFLNSEHPDDKELRRGMDSDLVAAIRAGRNIRLDNFLVSMVARKQHRYEPRGTSICLRILKDLMYEDKLREAQYAIAEGHITPKQVWKIGDKDHPPLARDLRAFRDLLLEAQNDPIFSLVCHYAVTPEFVGSTGKILPLLPEFEFIYNRILTGLFISKPMVGAEGPTYANSSVASRMLMARYITLRGRLEQWALRKIFAPVAAANEFYKRSKAEIDHRVYPTPDRQELTEDTEQIGEEGYQTKVLDLPQFDWRAKSNLLDDTLAKQLLLQLHQRTAVPMRVVCEALELDYRMAETWLKREEGTVFDPLYQEIRKRRAEAAIQMSLRPPGMGGPPMGGGVMPAGGEGLPAMGPAGAGAPPVGMPPGTPPAGGPGTAAGPAGIPGRPAPPVPGTIAPTLGPGGGMAAPPATPGMAPASLGEPKPVFADKEEEDYYTKKDLENPEDTPDEPVGLATRELARLSKNLTKDTVKKRAAGKGKELAFVADAADKVQDSSLGKKATGFPFVTKELNLEKLRGLQEENDGQGTDEESG